MSNPRKYIAKKERVDSTDLELSEKVVFINRVAKVMKGGRRFHFTAIVVVGDMAGHVGAAMARATAGGCLPAALERPGVTDGAPRPLPSNTPANTVKATLLGLSQLRSPDEVR